LQVVEIFQSTKAKLKNLYQKLNKFLGKNNFNMLKFGYNVYINQNKGEIIAIYVNDFIIFARDITIFY
jgi:hypothetical protein